MATAEISVGQVMGAGAPTYAPARASQTLTTTTANAVAALVGFSGPYQVLDGDYLTVTMRGSTAGAYVAIGKVATTNPRQYIAEGQTIDIGPLKAGDTINIADVA
jgi:hypothetical protein